MRIGAALAVAVVGSFVLVGCGKDAAAPPSPAAASTSAASASSSEWSREQAGQEYLRIVGPANAISAEGRSLPQSASIEAYRPLCKRTVTALDQQMRDLDAGAWPSDTRPAIDDLIAESAATRTWFAGCAAAKSLGDMAALAPPPTRSAGSVVRVKLGLPPVEVPGASPSGGPSA